MNDKLYHELGIINVCRTEKDNKHLPSYVCTALQREFPALQTANEFLYNVNIINAKKLADDIKYHKDIIFYNVMVSERNKSELILLFRQYSSAIYDGIVHDDWPLRRFVFVADIGGTDEIINHLITNLKDCRATKSAQALMLVLPLFLRKVKIEFWEVNGKLIAEFRASENKIAIYKAADFSSVLIK